MHEAGFDNYPLLSAPPEETLFLFERMLGCRVRAGDGQAGSTFNTWCEPVVDSPRDIRRLSVDLDGGDDWRSFELALSASRRGDAQCLPAAEIPFTPLDWACNLCSAERLFMWLYDAEDDVAALLEMLCDLYLQVRLRIDSLGVTTRNWLGFPCVYCNDLQMGSLSPAMIDRFILPRYRQVARRCGGMILALHTNDLGIVGKVAGCDDFIGCCFDKRLPLADIRRLIGRTIFVMLNYAYDDSLPGPAFRDGLYWNPIVQSYSRGIDQVYRELADECSMIFLIERPRLDQVCNERDRLQNLLPLRSAPTGTAWSPGAGGPATR